MKTFTLVALLVLLVACTVREVPRTAVPIVSSPSASPAVSEATPATASYTPTVPPPTAGTTSSEPIGDTTDCVVKGDCVSYVDHGVSVEKCAAYDDVGCYHHYACSPSGEAVQKETPAFCGR